MNIQILTDFSQKLQGLNRSHSYLSELNGRYTLVSAKSNKILNAGSIGNIAERHLAAIDKLDDSSFKLREQLFKNLKIGLISFKSRLYQSKTWYQKIAHFFGCISKEERRINQTIGLIEIRLSQTPSITPELIQNSSQTEPVKNVNLKANEGSGPLNLKAIQRPSKQLPLPPKKTQTEKMKTAHVSLKTPSSTDPSKRQHPSLPSTLAPQLTPLPMKQSSRKNTNSVNSQLISISKLVQDTIEIQKLDTKQRETDPISYLKHFFLGILDSMNMSMTALDGMSTSQAVFWYMEHLKAFLAVHKTGSKYSKVELDQLSSFIQHLEFASDLNYLNDSYVNSSVKEWQRHLLNNPKTTLKELQTVSLIAVQKLPLRAAMIELITAQIDALQPGERLLLPGGYACESKTPGIHISGHAVVYSISRDKQGDYKFLIVNTGEGSVQNSNTSDMFKNMLKYFKSFITNKYCPRTTIQDIEFHQIKRQELSEMFIGSLLDKGLCNQVKSMQDIHNFLEASFGKNKLSPLGRLHKAQNHGSCSHKCISASAKALLPAKLYLEFKVWMTEREINKFEFNMDAGQFTSLMDSETQQLFIKEAREILEKRKRKAAAAQTGIP